MVKHPDPAEHHWIGHAANTVRRRPGSGASGPPDDTLRVIRAGLSRVVQPPWQRFRDRAP
jgi:hypothetical protein